jgi:predicted transcriptional regulator
MESVMSLTLAGVSKLLEAEVLCGKDLSVTIDNVGAADLMSDVLALSRSGLLLLTGLVNAQVIRTAIIADLIGVVFVRGKKPPESILALARESGIPVLSTSLTMFEAAGKLYLAIYGRVANDV